MRFGLLAIALLFVLPRLGRCQGGPPLITDDPDTPGSGHWEINTAITVQASSGRTALQIPTLDFNYGLGEVLQLKLETGWQVLFENDLGSKSGFGTTLAGVKWRFLDQKDHFVSVSTYPQLEFHNFFSSKDPELVEPGTSLLLPIEVSRKSENGLSVDAEFGFRASTHVSGEWIYGIVFGFSASKKCELLFELHGDVHQEFSQDELLANVGARVELSDLLTLLASAGRTLRQVQGEDPRILAYLGLRFTL